MSSLLIGTVLAVAVTLAQLAPGVLLAVNYRPEYRHGWGSKTYYRQLRIDPLPPESADALLRALLGADPSTAPLASLLIARTEGNPLFLEESAARGAFSGSGRRTSRRSRTSSSA